MRGHWASAEALKNDPIVAKGMNAPSKVVYSRTLTSADWSNTEDEYLMMVCPLALGEGKAMFEGITDSVALNLLDLRRFRGGSVLLTYVPA